MEEFWVLSGSSDDGPGVATEDDGKEVAASGVDVAGHEQEHGEEDAGAFFEAADVARVQAQFIGAVEKARALAEHDQQRRQQRPGGWRGPHGPGRQAHGPGHAAKRCAG